MFYSMRYLLPMGMTLLCGCLSFNMEGPDDKVQSKERIETVSVHAESLQKIRPRVWRDQYGRGKFSLLCDGDFKVEQSRIVEGVRSGKRVLSIGFFPGMYGASVTAAAGGPDYKLWPLMGFGMIVVNGFTAGLPTLLSLFYEPFDSYHDGNCGILSTLAFQGLVGCHKQRQWDPWEKEFCDKTSRTYTDHTYALPDFAVSINGTKCSCGMGESEVTFSLPANATSEAVRVVKVPRLEGELGQCADSLVGSDFIVPVEKSVEGRAR